jgi:hypothetical protein
MPVIAKPSTTQKIFATIVTAIAWTGVLMQLYLTNLSIIDFFSYFTILSNTLVVVCLCYSLLAPTSRPGAFFSRVSVQSAAALYILIVGIVYNTVLRGLVELKGWEQVSDNIVHVAVPVLFVLYWLIFVRRGALQWKDTVSWIYFPLVYLIYSLIRGAIVHWYPYPFLNATRLGYGKVLLNIGIMLAVFFVAGIILIAINRSLKKN